MKKLGSCILAFAPGVLLFITLIAAALFSSWGSDPMSSFEVFVGLAMVALAFLAVILCFTVMILYIIKTVKSPYISADMKAVWCILLYMFNVFVFPVFWFKYIRNQ